MTDFQKGIVVGAGVVLYLLLTIGPQFSTYMRRRRVLADAARRLAAAQARMPRGWISRREAQDTRRR